MKFSRFILYLILLPFALFLFLLVYGTLSDYRPSPEKTIIQTENVQTLTDSTFKLMIWNIGYGGLGDGMDFYLISPNLEAVEVRGVDLDFKHSYHQPVLATIRIKP